MIYELTPKFEKVKSYYQKAKIEIDEKGNKTLISYSTKIIILNKNNDITWINKEEHVYNRTTVRHLSEFLQQQGMKKLGIKEIRKIIKGQK